MAVDRSRAGAIERYGRYVELRDSGMSQADAAREVGIAEPGRYERSYRELRGLKPKPIGAWASQQSTAR